MTTNIPQAHAGVNPTRPPFLSTRHGTKIKVIVTQEAIDEAIQNSTTECAISCSLGDQGFFRPMTDLQSIRFSDRAKGVRYIYFTPKVVQDFLIAFDAGENVSPFEFVLRAPAQVLPQGVGGRPPTIHWPPKKSPVKVGGRTPRTTKQVRVFGIKAYRVNQEKE